MSSPCRIAVIEDETDINELIAYNLRKEGMEVSSAFDGISATALLEREHFDVVLLDIMLPGIDGLTICKEIKNKADAFKTFVIIITAKVEAQDKLYAHLLGADGYITKPFSVESLLRTVKELCALKQQPHTVKSV